MTDKIELQLHAPEGSDLKCEYNKKSLHRIRRIKGQLDALERLIEADAGSCEERVIRARTIEKAMASLITHMVDCYLVNTARHEIEADPDQAIRDIKRVFELINK